MSTNDPSGAREVKRALDMGAKSGILVSFLWICGLPKFEWEVVVGASVCHRSTDIAAMKRDRRS